MAFKSTRAVVDDFPVEREVWCRVGSPATDEAEKRYHWVKPGQHLDGYFEEVKKVNADSSDEASWIVKLISDDMVSRYIVYIPERVVKYIRRAIEEVQEAAGVGVGFMMRLSYHGKKQAVINGKKVYIHDIEILYDDENICQEIVSHYAVKTTGGE